MRNLKASRTSPSTWARELEQTNAALQVEMKEREAAEEQFRQAQKMEAVGQLAGGWRSNPRAIGA